MQDRGTTCSKNNLGMEGDEASSSRHPLVGVQNSLNMVLKFIVFPPAFSWGSINVFASYFINIFLTQKSPDALMARLSRPLSKFFSKQLFDLDQTL